MTSPSALEAVHDRTTFLAFVAALLEEVGQDRGGREINTRTEAFLEAALAATVDREEGTDLLDQPTWRGFATFLYLGLIDE
ncbi:hypothetical protein [Deinococcus planocerae]|uniref:hypothetical protein n=1 Tax=Deinococcus planocerae TaxID=1737569 RepID=UPI000C7F21CD|nr:hypothetical protein [Deinococcus planocerae]